MCNIIACMLAELTTGQPHRFRCAHFIIIQLDFDTISIHFLFLIRINLFISVVCFCLWFLSMPLTNKTQSNQNVDLKSEQQCTNCVRSREEKNDCSFVPSESLNFIYGSFDIDQVANVNHNALTAICFDISTNCFGLLVLFYEINALC